MVEAAQLPRKILLLLRVTEPTWASNRPSTFVPWFTVIEFSAMRVPTKLVVTPSDASSPICQNTLHAEAPLVRRIRLEVAVVRDSGIWNTQTASELP